MLDTEQRESRYVEQAERGGQKREHGRHAVRPYADLLPSRFLLGIDAGVDIPPPAANEKYCTFANQYSRAKVNSNVMKRAQVATIGGFPNSRVLEMAAFFLAQHETWYNYNKVACDKWVV